MTIQEKILHKLEDDIYPDLNSELIYKLSNESERGTVLIGTSKIEEFLELFISKILPQKSNKYQKRLLDYPGPLSSFSSKIELLYAFRYLNNRFYIALNILRKLRNDAAHSYNDFSLEIESEKINQINDFLEDIEYVIAELSLNNLLIIKQKKLERIYLDKGITVDNSQIYKTLEEFKKSEYIEKQHRIWKLSYGIVFMCLYVMVLIEENNYLEDLTKTHPVFNKTQ